MQRRQFLKGSAALSGLALLGAPGLTRPAGAMGGPYGALQPADFNGLRLPVGFTSRIVAGTGNPVYCTDFVWHPNPDGGAVFAQDDGGWVYVSNDESNRGGASMLRFNGYGDVIDARSILSGSQRNCSGGPMPWGTWLSCEEAYRGRVWECDPLGQSAAVLRTAMGRFSHEAAAADPNGQTIYLTEDESEGGLYRFTPTTWGDLSSGLLEIMTETEVEIPNPDDPDGDPLIERRLGWATVPDPSAADTPTRYQVEDTRRFDGGEGAWFDNGSLYFTVKGTNQVWRYRPASNALDVIYDVANAPNPVLRGVDAITVSPSGDIFVCEDGGNMEVVILSTEGDVTPFLQLENAAGSELTGVAFDPWGGRMYVSSQRDPGTTYEITGPFRSPNQQPGLPPRPDPGQGDATGTVRFTDGAAPTPMTVELFQAQGDGSPSNRLQVTTTDSGGRFTFTGYDAGAYTIGFFAPAGERFVGGGDYLLQPFCVEAGSATVVDAELASTGFFTGRVTTAEGAGVAAMSIDLFRANGDGSRGPWIGDTQTDNTGRYTFEVDNGCYVLTYIAPEGSNFDNGTRYLDTYACVGPGDTVTLDAQLGGGGGGQTAIGGTITYAAGGAAPGVTADLFQANGDGSRGPWIGDTQTDNTGRYTFDVNPACYVVTLIAPNGTTFTNGDQYNQQSGCVTEGQTIDNLNAQLA